MDAGNKDQAQPASQVVCPHCFEPITSYTMYGVLEDRYGRITRNYFGWCDKCQTGYEVCQFDRDNKWHIHKFRYYASIQATGRNLPQQWRLVEQLPDAAAVVTGPGGDFDRPTEIKVKQCHKCQLKSELKETTNKLCQVLHLIYEIFKTEKA